MSKHTPGPWKVKCDGNFVITTIGELDTICQLFNRCEEDFGNKHANARLIAAAPDMLTELLKVEWAVDVNYDGKFLYYCPSCGNVKKIGHTPDCTLAAAITKATGAS